MAKSIIAAIFLGIITVFAALLLVQDRNDELQNVFEIDAVYDESRQVIVTFSDRSGKTSNAVLQVLGMDKPFQKMFEGSGFIQEISFPTVPKYGWKAHPVIVDIIHADFGHVQLKTEVRFAGEPSPPVIYGRP